MATSLTFFVMERPLSATAEPPIFRCDVEPDRDRARVVLTGELDLAGVEPLEREIDSLLGSGFRRIVVDLRGLTFLDSSGLRYVLTLARSASEDGFRLELIQGGDAVRRLFELTGTQDALPFVDAP